MSIGEICNRETVFTTKDSSISQAAQLMREQHVGDLVVVEEKGGRRIPVGILTDRDLVIEILAKGVDMNAVTVGDVMSSELLTARESDGLYETLQRMRAKACGVCRWWIPAACSPASSRRTTCSICWRRAHHACPPAVTRAGARAPETHLRRREFNGIIGKLKHRRTEQESSEPL